MGKNYHQTFHTKIKNLHSGEVTLTFFLQADSSCSLFSNAFGKQTVAKQHLLRILHSGELLKTFLVGKMLVAAYTLYKTRFLGISNNVGFY